MVANVSLFAQIFSVNFLSSIPPFPNVESTHFRPYKIDDSPPLPPSFETIFVFCKYIKNGSISKKKIISKIFILFLFIYFK